MSSPTAPAGEKLLVVDDAVDTLEVLRRNLERQGFEVVTAQNVAQAVEALEEGPVDLVITDLKMPGASGLDLIRFVRESYRDTEVMMITGYATIEGAVEAVKVGAEEYLAKPFTQDELLGAVRKALDKVRIRKAQRTLASAGGDLLSLLGTSEPMARVAAAARKAAASNLPVLITGERGTGRSLIARAIHYRGARAAAPFVQVSCPSMPEEMIERELFGHVKGAFRGAEETRGGLFHMAEGGTLFLDEIGGLGPSLQGRILRFLSEKVVSMVGGRKPESADVRLVAGASRDLLALVNAGAFREDLLYRVGLMTIAVPPLRERPDDIAVLALHFLRRFASGLGRAEPKISDRALELLRAYPWPGNVRELEDVMAGVASALDGDVMEAAHVPPLVRLAAARESAVQRPLAEVEADHVRNVLASVNGNKTRAAEILGIDRKTLREKLKERDEASGQP